MNKTAIAREKKGEEEKEKRRARVLDGFVCEKRDG
jgi:hypothetical protein